MIDGLKPYPAYKDSGVPWLGDVPEHWEVRRLKHISTLHGRIGFHGLSSTDYGSVGILVVSGVNFANWCVDWKRCHRISEVWYEKDKNIQLRDRDLLVTKDETIGKTAIVSNLIERAVLDRVYGQQQVIPDDFSVGDYYISPEKYREMQRYRIFPGDVLVSVMGTVGKAAVVPNSVEPGIINPRLVRYRPNPDKVRSSFLQLAISSPTAQAQLIEGAKGTTMEGLNMQILGRLLLAIPSIDEQDAILTAVATGTKQVQRAIDAARRNVSFCANFAPGSSPTW